jgi:hypothetical protein
MHMRHRSSHHRHLGLFALLLLATVPGQTQQGGGRYTVEIVVFRTGGIDAAAGASDAGADATRAAGGDIAATAISGRRLGGAASKLRAAQGYRVLAHTAWSQAPAAWNSRRGVGTSTLGLGAAGLQGKIILERGQFLHLGFDLTVDDAGQRYRVVEVRRVKPDEAQYFDHPAVGILALVSAAQPPGA